MTQCRAVADVRVPVRSAPGFGPRSVAMLRRPCASWAYGAARSVPALGARYGFGRRGWFGRPVENPFPFFGFPEPNRALRGTENPRVDGSIPSLATISKFLICNGFRVSPADHPWALMADLRTIGKWVDGSIPGGAGPGSLAIWEPGMLAA